MNRAWCVLARGALVWVAASATAGRADVPMAAARAPAARRHVGMSADTGFQAESLMVAAHRAARAWARHDFEELVARSDGILLSLPGSDPSAPLRPAQAALLLHAFADGAEEVEVEVVVARNVDRDRAYVEARRTFTVRGTTTRGAQTIYLGLRLDGTSYRLSEVRVVP